MAAMRKVWVVLDAPAGKRMAPFLPEIVSRLRVCEELDIDDATAACVRDVGGHDRLAAGLVPGEADSAGQVGHQAGLAAEVPDPDPHLGRVGTTTYVPGFAEIDLGLMRINLFQWNPTGRVEPPPLRRTPETGPLVW